MKLASRYRIRRQLRSLELSPKISGMPVIPKKAPVKQCLTGAFVVSKLIDKRSDLDFRDSEFFVAIFALEEGVSLIRVNANELTCVSVKGHHIANHNVGVEH